MENKHVGWLLLGISVFVTVVILLFNSALKEIIKNSCGNSHFMVCPITTTVDKQTYVTLGIVGLLILVGFMLVLSKPQKEIIWKTVKEKNKKKIVDVSELSSEERVVFGLVQNNKAIFQADLIEKTGFGKAKMTRILDRLEGKEFVERKRRGMTNIVVLKNY